ncbi:MAG: DUF899 domain-containing protein [Alphaproteobacteria bacterium]|nr:DUF899 domain-containing protein [Alphaproteobacteria bacterium]
MKTGQIVSKDEWLKARLGLLEKEKQASRERDALTRQRMAMPWVEISKDYVFEGPAGQVSLRDLFEDHDQLIVYHFMFEPDWEAGCKSCSFIADHTGPSAVHIAQRDVAFAVVSIAPLEKLQAFKRRMGWCFKWVSSAGSDFNRDFHVSFTDAELDGKGYYNYREQGFPCREAPGVSVFAKGDDGKIYHTYSAYGRGLENLMGAYRLLDIVPKGRDEDGLSHNMEWLRLKDAYD